MTQDHARRLIPLYDYDLAASRPPIPLAAAESFSDRLARYWPTRPTHLGRARFWAGSSTGPGAGTAWPKLEERGWLRDMLPPYPCIDLGRDGYRHVWR